MRQRDHEAFLPCEHGLPCRLCDLRELGAAVVLGLDGLGSSVLPNAAEYAATPPDTRSGALPQEGGT